VRVLLIAILATSFTAVAAFGQTPAPPPAPAIVDGRTLQSILEELRRLRQDLQSTSATVERMQLLLYRMRNQMDIVSRATEKWEAARSAAQQMESQRTAVTNQIKQQEANLNSITDENARRAVEQRIENAKGWLSQLSTDEPEVQAREAESANDLRLEKDKLSQLEEEIGRLDKKLETVALR
jgi:predicted  nucleic acid-binding Zn-ribbon protein